MIVSEERRAVRLVPIRCKCGAEFGKATPKDKKETVRETICEKCKHGSFESYLAKRRVATCENCFSMFYTTADPSELAYCIECQREAETAKTVKAGGQYVWDNVHETDLRHQREEDYWMKGKIARVR